MAWLVNKQLRMRGTVTWAKAGKEEFQNTHSREGKEKGDKTEEERF